MTKKAMLPLIALSLAAASVAVPAAAQHRAQHNGPAYQNVGNWQSINQRQANLDRRIDQGSRNGQISRREATRLRGEFNSLLRLENQYRRGGLTQWERADLDRRFDRLSAGIRYERRDNDNRRG
jgi:Ni/Co efflux regulator RcnB